jgi:6-pyruvoyltetrahydropterin/6-carboxytetrahydropterin synthase
MKIEIDGGHTGIRFSACHFIPRHEKCSRLHGHSYTVRLILEGNIGEDGMVMDFVKLKRALKALVDEFDHRILLPRLSPEVRLIEEDGEIEVHTGGKRYVFPTDDVLLLDISQTTAEEMSQMMLERIVEDADLPDNVNSVELGLDEEMGQTAWAKLEW